MSNIALVTDTHFGVMQDSPSHLKRAVRFFEEFFFPYCDQNGIRHVIHLGDVFDRQTNVNFRTLHEFQRCFLRNIVRRGMSADILVGNHDSFYKNTIEINALRSIFHNSDELPSIRYIWEVEQVVRSGLNITLVPWIPYPKVENFRRSVLPGISSPILAGHFEIQAFEMSGGFRMEHGIAASELERFKLVLSGHFHKRQTRGNITYVGTPYQMDWGDYGQPKGFAILDPADPRRVTFVDNPESAFHRISYLPGAPVPSFPEGSNVHIDQEVIPSTAAERRKFEAWLDKVRCQQDIRADVVVAPAASSSLQEEIEAVPLGTTLSPDLFRDYVSLVSSDVVMELGEEVKAKLIWAFETAIQGDKA